MFALAANHYRSRLRKLEPELLELEEATTRATENSPEKALEQQQLDKAVHLAVARLSPKYRDILVLYYFHGMDLSEAAASLGLPEGTAKAQLHRARALLHGRLKEFLAD